MKLLLPNFPPVSIEGTTKFIDQFHIQLVQKQKINIAVGYVASDALLHLENVGSLYEYCNLYIGMCKWESVTRGQYDTIKRFNNYLREHEKGEVKIFSSFLDPLCLINSSF